MKVFLSPHYGLSRAMDRVALALATFAPPDVQVVRNEDDADLVVLHAIGFPETQRRVEQLGRQGRRFSIIQYCLRTTQCPSTRSWMPLWTEAESVWSYYDLPGLCSADGLTTEIEEPNFYVSPLGGDASVFRESARDRKYTILTSGYVAETEGVREAAVAAERVGGEIFHLGHHLGVPGRVTYAMGIDDKALAAAYSASQFVAGLRRIEGFELPAVEGLLCGARPIMFDRPHYRRWFGGFAEYIKEGTFEEVTDALASLFAAGPRPVGEAERMAAAHCFDWESIVRGYWEKTLNA